MAGTPEVGFKEGPEEAVKDGREAGGEEGLEAGLEERPDKLRAAEEVTRFVERFASNLVDAGMPRMPARVFAALLATDSGSLSAAELATMLRASPAAISGAVRYLAQVDGIVREREPGSRRDHYRLYDDAWYEMLVRRDQLISRWADSMRVGIELVGPASAAGRRLQDTLAFFQFVQEEMPEMLARWRKRRAELAHHQRD